MEREQTAQAMAFFAALADVERLKLVALLAQGAQSGPELAAALGLKQSAVNHHLNRLRRAGLLRLEGGSSAERYALDEESLRALSRRVLAGGARFEVPAESGDWERKVLQSFFTPDGRLTELPAQTKKRQVVLKRLAAEFEPGVQYPEKVVNERLRRFHEDVATVRRELYEAGLIHRQNGIYWLSAE